MSHNFTSSSHSRYMRYIHYTMKIHDEHEGSVEAAETNSFLHRFFFLCSFTNSSCRRDERETLEVVIFNFFFLLPSSSSLFFIFLQQQELRFRAFQLAHSSTFSSLWLLLMILKLLPIIIMCRRRELAHTAPKSLNLEWILLVLARKESSLLLRLATLQLSSKKKLQIQTQEKILPNYDEFRLQSRHYEFYQRNGNSSSNVILSSTRESVRWLVYGNVRHVAAQ